MADAPQPEEDERDRRSANIFLLVMAVVVIGGGIWLVNALIADRDLQNCVSAGRRDCAPIQAPER